MCCTARLAHLAGSRWDQLQVRSPGWEVRTERPVFVPQVVTLMDFDTDQHDGTAFFYVLPEAPDRALIEHTMFSLDPRDRRFHDGRVSAHLDRLGAGPAPMRRSPARPICSSPWSSCWSAC